MSRFFTLTMFVCLLSVSAQIALSENDAPVKSIQSVTGILMEVTQTSVTIRMPDGKETSFMRGFKLKMPEKVGKGSLVTVHINPILNVVKSVELGTGKQQ